MIHDLFYALFVLVVLQVDVQLIVAQRPNYLPMEPPTIVPSNLGKIFVEKGNKATGICFDAVTGNNNGLLQVWSNPDSRRVTKFTFDGRCLHIFAQDVRSSRYVISVSNRYGRANATFRLIYFEAPGIKLYYRGRVIVNHRHYAMMVKFTNINVKCEISGEPAPALRWYCNGRAIRSTKTGQFCLISVSDGGLYTVEATNIKGIAKSTFVLHLPGLPHIYFFCKSWNDSLSCNTKYLELRCSGSSVPIPVVAIKVSGETSTSKKCLSVTYQEIIRNTSERNYTCSASNSYGTVTETCIIHVKIGRPPVLAIEDYTTAVKIMENRKQVFNCSLASDPFPAASVTWFQGYVEKTEWRNFSIVEVTSSADTHLVPFTCRVSNDCGHDARTFILDVVGNSMYTLSLVSFVDNTF